jgi:hypothetical protein
MPILGRQQIRKASPVIGGYPMMPVDGRPNKFIKLWELDTKPGCTAERLLKSYLSAIESVDFRTKGLSQVTSGLIQEYRIKRIEGAKAAYGHPPARNTLHQEMVALRQVLKLAVRHGHLAHLPDLSQPYRTNTKISHRAWFSPEEYKLLYKATRDRVDNPRPRSPDRAA